MVLNRLKFINHYRRKFVTINKKILLFLVVLTIPFQIYSQWDYPPTQVETVIDELHGIKISDDYRWLENGSNQVVVNWVDAQMVFSRSILDTLPQRDMVANTLTDLYNMPVMTNPELHGQRYFYFRRIAGQNHQVLYFTDDFPGENEQVVLDPNKFSAEGTIGLDWHYPSPSGSLLAYGASFGGSEISTLRVREVATQTDLVIEIPYTRASPVVWLPDESGFYYVRYPEPGTVPEGDEYYFRRLFFHNLADSIWRDDPMIFGADLGRADWVNAYPSSDQQFMFIYVSVNWAINDLYFMPIDQPEAIKPLAVGLDGSFTADVFDNNIYLLTNLEAPRYRILTVSVSEPEQENWHEIIPASAVRLESFIFADGQLTVITIEDVVSHLWMYSLDGKRKWEIPLPMMGSITKISGNIRSYDLFFNFESFTYQPAIYHFDLFSDRLMQLEQAPSTIDFSSYIIKQVFYPSRDGTSIPMFIIHHDNIELNGDNPTLLYGYGGFDISLNPYFSKTAVAWIEAGGVYAVANLRGGGEYGRDWHEAARLEKKQNCYDDFIAAGEWLIDNGYTNSRRLACLGGSNGGLLVGVAITQRPDLWQAAVSAVPLLDMVRYHKFSIARLWIPEFGSSEDCDQFNFIYRYSPYHNVKSYTNYPATMFTTSEYNTRVDPLHACKMTALMQKKNSGDRPILLRYEQSSGHSVGKPVSKKIEETVDVLSFLMWQLGVE